MPGSARERLQNIMMATQHSTRSPEHLQIELLQLVAELLIEIKQDLRDARPAPPAMPTVATNGHENTPAVHAAAFGL